MAAQAKPRLSRPILYGLLLTVLAAAYLMLDEQTPRRGAPRRNSATAKKLNLPEGFLEADLAAKFDPVEAEIKNSFQPLVISSKGSSVALRPDSVPSVLTGGDPNWIYTGMAEVDGIAVGLLENKSTGEGSFVKESEIWKLASIVSISPTALSLRGQTGKIYTLSILDQSGTSLPASGGYMPVTPDLRGPIGPVAVEPSRDSAPMTRNRPNRDAAPLNTETRDEN